MYIGRWYGGDTDLSERGASDGREGLEGDEAQPSVREGAGLGAGERGGTGPDTSVERAEGAAGFGREKGVPGGGEAVAVGCKLVGGFVVEGWPAGFQGSVLPIVSGRAAARKEGAKNTGRSSIRSDAGTKMRADDGIGRMTGRWAMGEGP